MNLDFDYLRQYGCGKWQMMLVNCYGGDEVDPYWLMKEPSYFCKSKRLYKMVFRLYKNCKRHEKRYSL